MGIHPRSPAVRALRELGVTSDSAIGGWGTWYGRGTQPTLKSGQMVSLSETFQNRPGSS